MRVQGSVTTHTEVDIYPRDAWQALQYHIASGTGIPVGARIEDGKIVRDEDHHTSHSWTETKVIIPEPTPEQLAQVRAIATITEVLRFIERSPK